MEATFTTEFWIGLLQIMWVDILLSGDNAVVIALAARGLPRDQQKKAIYIGTIAAIIMRVVLTFVAAKLLTYPWLKGIGGLLLLYIGVSLLFTNTDEQHDTKEKTSLFAAIRYILLADLVMSLDNVLAVAAAAKGHMGLLIIGLILSVPLVIFGSTMLLKVIEKFPVIVWLGAALLGFIAGEMIFTDPALEPYFHSLAENWGISMKVMKYGLAGFGALLVLIIGSIALSIQKKKSAP